jgi:type II secretory pathway pseudopilin PulG
MAKTKYLKDQTNGGTQSPPLDRRFVSDNSRTLELSNFSTLELPRVGFTVLELLIVIGVLTVLLAIMLPTIKTVRSASLRNRAQAEATALAQAAVHYKTEYGFWPGQLMPC